MLRVRDTFILTIKSRGLTMRKVTINTVNAFMNGYAMGESNTVVTVEGHKVSMILHGNTIATRNTKSNVVRISNCGYESNVTKERLNGIIADVLGHSAKIYQKAGVWYWKDGKKFPCDKFVIVK